MNARTPSDALAVLRAASHDGRLDELCDRHGMHLRLAFGSTVAGPEPDAARDLDIAADGDEHLDALGLLADLTDLTDLDAIDLLDLRRAGPVAAVEALQLGEALVEQRSDLADGRLMRAALEKLDTQWLRDWALELMASDPPGRPRCHRRATVAHALAPRRDAKHRRACIRTTAIRPRHRYALERLVTLIVDAATALNSHVASRTLDALRRPTPRPSISLRRPGS